MRLLVLSGAVGFFGGCGQQVADERQTGASGGGQAAKAQPAPAAHERYPEPRFPAYLRPPKSREEIVPYARTLVRNKSGFQGKGFGILQAGESVLIVPTVTADEMVLEAIKRALQERKITAHIVPNYQLVGLKKEDAVALRKARQDRSAEQGYFQASAWVEDNFLEPETAKAWLKQRRPDLYEALFPTTRDLTPARTSTISHARRRHRPRRRWATEAARPGGSRRLAWSWVPCAKGAAA